MYICCTLCVVYISEMATEMTPEYIFDKITYTIALDPEELERMFNYTVNQTDSLSYNNLGFFYKCGIYVEKNADKAFEWYTKSAELGNSYGMTNLGLMLSKNDNDPNDISKAKELHIKSAELGNSYAMNSLGQLFEREENYETALIWYTKAANLGNKFAMNNLGTYCYNKNKDKQKSLEWFLKSAELGYYAAMDNLGMFYKIENDYDKALEWFLKAVEIGYSNSMYHIGYMYYKNKKNKDLAIEWLTKAVELDNLESIYLLAKLYIEDENYENALLLLVKIGKIKINMNINEDYRYSNTLSVSKNIIDDLIKTCRYKTKKLENIYNDINVDSCACCLETLKNTNDCILTIICGHSFHYNCINKCKNCPVCRENNKKLNKPVMFDEEEISNQTEQKEE